MFEYLINKFSDAYNVNETRHATDFVITSSVIITTCLGFGTKSYHEHEVKCESCKGKSVIV
jgi:DnaJ-class molecular chaperone